MKNRQNSYWHSHTRHTGRGTYALLYCILFYNFFGCADGRRAFHPLPIEKQRREEKNNVLRYAI